jgi:adenine-specific DNA-methyltransferase
MSNPAEARGAETAEREPFAFTWPGKRAATQRAEEPPRSTLAPVEDESVRFGMTGNRFIEGENLEALKHLAHEYSGAIDLIYIDPPYNTGNTFIFHDRYADPSPALAIAKERRVPGAARSRRHARWLSMLYPRLLLARRLLRENGVFCMSIGEDEVHHARLLLDEVFGEANHRNTLAIRRYDKNLSRQFLASGLPSLAVGFEYILIYARSPAFAIRPVYREASARRRSHGYWKGFWNAADRPTMRYPLLGVTPAAGQWKWQESVARAAVANYEEYLREHADALSLEEHWEATGRAKRFLRRNPAGRGRNLGVEHWIPPAAGILRTSNWTDLLASESLARLGLPFDSPKSVRLLEDLLRLCSGPDALVLDFFAGSATTAHAVLNLNAAEGASRRFLLVQSAEPTGRSDFPTIAEIAKERIRRVLARLDAEQPSLPPDAAVGAQPAAPTAESASRPDRGFDVYWLEMIG